MQNYMYVSMQGHCVSETINFGDQGSQTIHSGTHRFRMFHHPTHKCTVLIDFDSFKNKTKKLSINVKLLFYTVQFRLMKQLRKIYLRQVIPRIFKHSKRLCPSNYIT